MLELTRDARTVFVSQLVARLTEREIREFFEKVRGCATPCKLSVPANTFSHAHSLLLSPPPTSFLSPPRRWVL